MSRLGSASFEECELPRAQPVRWWTAASLAAMIAVAFVALPYVPFFQDWPVIRDTKVSSAVTWTVLQTVIVVISLVAMLSFVGRARLERAAFRATSIEVRAFDDERSEASPDREVSSAKWLTMSLKKIINESRLYAPTPVTGVGASFDFIRTVEEAGGTADSWWRVATKLVRLTQPPASFTVTGTVRPVGENGERRLVVELFRSPRFAATPIVIEDDDWPRVLERAASAIAALIIPRSAYARTNLHWSGWRDARIPPDLFDAYQRANQFAAARRFDDALSEYYRALRLDPSNVYIRVEIGALQEQLDLWLDALLTYDDVIAICSRSHRNLSWWMGSEFAQQRRKAGKNRDVALLIARFRHALALGNGDVIAAEWWLPRRTGVARLDDRGRRRRAELREVLSRRFQRYVDLDVRTQPDPMPLETRLGVHRRLLRAFVEEGSMLTGDSHVFAECAARAAELRSYMCALAQYEIERLIADSTRFWRRRQPGRQELTSRALHLSLILIVLKRAMADVHPPSGEVPLPQRVHVGSNLVRRFGLADLFPDGRWPPHPAALVRAVEGVGRRRTRRECYNAVSVYTTAMLEVGPRGSRDLRNLARNPRLEGELRDEVARRAVRELDQASTLRERGRPRQSWGFDDEPEMASLHLAPLRGHVAFTDYETVTFGLERVASLRPMVANVWEQVSYIRQLICAIAACRENLWRMRGAEAAPPARVLDEWLTADAKAMQAIANVAISRQDWRTRHRAIEACRRWSVEAGWTGTVKGFPVYSEEALAVQLRGAMGPRYGGGLDVNALARMYILYCDKRLDSLAENGHLPTQKTADKFAVVDDLSLLRVELWASLRAWFDDEIADGSSAAWRQEQFLECVKRQ